MSPRTIARASSAVAILGAIACKSRPADRTSRELVVQSLVEAGCTSSGGDGAEVAFVCRDVKGSLDTSNLDTQLAGVADPERRLAMARQFVKGATASSAHEGEGTELPRAALLPSLKSRESVEATLSRVPPEKRDAFSIPSHTIVEGVVVVIVVDRADTMELVSSQDLDKWKTTPQVLFPIALTNLSSRAAAAPEKQALGGATIVAYPHGDEYTAARVLLPQTQEKLATLLGGPAVFAIPTRDRLLAARADDTVALAALRREATRTFAAGPYPITDVLIQADPKGGFRILPKSDASN